MVIYCLLTYYIYTNSNNDDKRKTRIQSFTEKSGITEGSSGLTLGLILKEYCEFKVRYEYWI